MASVAKVIERLKSQKLHLMDEHELELKKIDLYVIRGGEKAKERAVKRVWARIEVIDYVINFLEGEEGEPCQS